MNDEYGKNTSITDETLCARAASGDRAAEETLVLRYSRLVRVCARPFYLAGGDSEDLIQEGMLGLLSAIREFTEFGAGYRIAAVCAAVLCGLGGIVFAFYNEKKVLGVLAT